MSPRDLLASLVAIDSSSSRPNAPVLGETDGMPIKLPRPLEFGYAQRTALAELGILHRLRRDSHGQVRVVRTVDDIHACLRDGALAAVIHFEGAEPIDPHLDALEVFYEAGLRSLGPVWSRANDFGEGVPYLYPHSPDTGPGLTDLVAYARGRGAKIILAGDVSQLQAVEKGGGMSLLAA